VVGLEAVEVGRVTVEVEGFEAGMEEGAGRAGSMIFFISAGFSSSGGGSG
jgi:hypothetical protein